MKKENLLTNIPNQIPEEMFRDIMVAEAVRIEQIVSRGHSTPEGEWYDQQQNEWVLVIKGAGILVFEDGSEVVLNPGDHLNIPAHKKHRVSWTAPEEETIWLAVFY